MIKTALHARFAGSRFLAKFAFGLAFLAAAQGCAGHRDVEEAPMGGIKALPQPDINSSAFLQIMKKRRTTRDFANKPLGVHLLSGLLWAAYGVNRAGGMRTAPSAHDWQYVDVYLADPTGLYQYNPRRHSLDLVKSGDLRGLTGIQSFAATAPVSLVLVSDERKFPADVSPDDRMLFAAATSGAVAQNVYLFSAANDLNAAVRADIDRPRLHSAMGLAPEQKILLAQSVGYPPTLSAIKTGIKSLFGGD